MHIEIFGILDEEGFVILQWCVEKYPGRDHLRVRQKEALLFAQVQRLQHFSPNYLPKISQFIGEGAKTPAIFAKIYLLCRTNCKMSLNIRKSDVNILDREVTGCKLMQAENHELLIQFSRVA